MIESFYQNQLKILTDLFKKEEMALCYYKDKDGNDVVLLAHVKSDPFTHGYKIIPYARFWNNNPLWNLFPTKDPILAIQKPLSLRDKNKSIKIDPLMIN